MIKYREWCSKPFSRCGLLIEQSRIDKMVKANRCSGYSSLYYFNEVSAEYIRSTKRSIGLNKHPVGCEHVVIDLDDGDKQVSLLESRLHQLGLGYTVWLSGLKGFHFYINAIDKFDINLPYSQRLFVESLDVPCDLSLYQHGRLISLEGRIHPRTKKPKTKLRVVEGDAVDIKIVERPIITYTGEVEDVSKEVSLLSISDLILNEPDVGNRHTLIWGTAKDLLASGWSLATVEHLLVEVNASWTNPKEDEEVRAAVTQAWRQIYEKAGC